MPELAAMILSDEELDAVAGGDGFTCSVDPATVASDANQQCIRDFGVAKVAFIMGLLP